MCMLLLLGIGLLWEVKSSSFVKKNNTFVARAYLMRQQVPLPLIDLPCTVVYKLWFQAKSLMDYLKSENEKLSGIHFSLFFLSKNVWLHSIFKFYNDHEFISRSTSFFPVDTGNLMSLFIQHRWRAHPACSPLGAYSPVAEEWGVCQ